MIAPNAGLSVNRQCTLLRISAQQLLLSTPAGVGGGARSSQSARPDFHRASGVWQSAAASGAVARGDFRWAPAHPAADAQTGAVRDQTEAQHQQAASRAQDLSLPTARQDDRSTEPGVGNRHLFSYIPMRHGFLYLVAIIDWATRRVLSWRLSNTQTAGFCVDALSEALARFGKPRIFNSDQGSQFTSDGFTRVLLDHGIEISMDGRGRCHDNIFVERLWWTVKHEWVYLRPAANGLEQKRSLVEFFDWYNRRRPHQALGWQTPDEAYFNRPASAVAEAA